MITARRRLITVAVLWLGGIAAGCAPVPLSPRHPITDDFSVAPVTGTPFDTTDLVSSHRRFGGFTGITTVDEPPGTRHLIAVGERGFWLDLPLPASDQNKPTFGLLSGLAGQPLLDNRDRVATGLVRLNDGSLVVAFSGRPRLWRYPAAAPVFSKTPEVMALPREIAALPYDDTAITLGQTADDRLIVTAKGRSWIGGQQGWTALSLPITAGSRPILATEPHDGPLLILEKTASGLPRLNCQGHLTELPPRLGTRITAVTVDRDTVLVLNDDGFAGIVATALIRLPLSSACSP